MDGMVIDDEPVIRQIMAAHLIRVGRSSDLLGLVRFLLVSSAERLLDGAAVALDPEAEALLAAHDWPGNVREMENVAGRALMLADDGHVTCAVRQCLRRARICASRS